MANTAQETLFEIFVEIAGEQVSNLGAIVNTGEELARSLDEVVTQIDKTVEAAADVRASSIVAPAGQGPGAGGQGSRSGVLDTLGSVASAVLKNALGAAPLIRGILSLFGGGDEPEPQSFTKFSLPPSIAFLAADTPGGFSSADFDQSGFLRASNAGSSVTMPGALIAPPGTEAAQLITVNVNAMDARSFLDRSDDIAAAVRSAMLNLNSLNDVVSEL